MNDLLVWVDCEMTGLDLGNDVLIEVAALVTDPELNVLGDGVDVVIHAEEPLLGGMLEIVREMHDKSGLTDAVRASSVTVAEAEDMVMEYVASFVKEPRTAPLCGNSIATDRGFLARRHATLRRVPALPHDRRVVDQGIVPAVVSRGRTSASRPKGLAHRALADIHESIRELEYYRRTVFVAPPGPDVDTARAIGLTVAAEHPIPG